MVMQREPVRAGAERQRQHGEIAVDRRRREQREAGDRQRRDEQVDGDEIEPGTARRRAAMSRAVAVLDDGDVELARQQQDRARPTAAWSTSQFGGSGARWITAAMRGLGCAAAARAGEAAEQPPDHEGADGEEGDELDQQFGRDRQHQPVLLLGRIDAAACRRPWRRRRAARRPRARSAAEGAPGVSRPFERVDHHQHRLRDRLELQRDIGRRRRSAR